MLVVLCGEPGQHINGLKVAARTVEKRGEFFDPAVLEQPDRFALRGSAGPEPFVAIPVLAMLERIGREVELSRRPLADSGEFGQVA